MMVKKISVILCLLMLALASVASAEVKEIVAEGSYTIGDRDTRETAKKHAVQDAMRIAVEKAGVYVESYSEVKNYQLTRDEINILAAGLVQVYDESVDFYDNGNVCRAVIYARVDTDNIDLGYLATHKKIGNRTYRVPGSKPASSPAPAPAREIPVTGLIIDYSRFREHGAQILHLDVNDCIKSEDGTIIYDKAIGGLLRGDLCYQDKDPARVYAKAGKHPIIVEPVYFEAYGDSDYYWHNPVLKKEDADYILEMNDKYDFLGQGRVYIIDVEQMFW